MLGFGIFTSFIPYIVMATLYVAYLLFSTFAGSKLSTEVAVSEINKNFIEEVNASSIEEQHSKGGNLEISFINYFDDNNTELSTDNIIPPPEGFILARPFIKEGPKLSLFCSFELFSRPPPLS